jgi:ADP-ribose pyrophosphatase
MHSIQQLFSWLVVAREVVARFPPFAVSSGKYQREDGFQKTMTTLDFPDWANSLAITPSKELILVRQYRPGSESFTLEFPGGIIEPGEDPACAAQRELFEETGYRGETPLAIGWLHPNPAMQGNRIHYFLVKNVNFCHHPVFDGEGEQCETVLIPEEEIPSLKSNPEFTHALCLAGLALGTQYFGKP